jgi:hypothetical protein
MDVSIHPIVFSCILLIFFVLIYFNNDFFESPVFYLLGYRCFIVQTHANRNYLFITKRKITEEQFEVSVLELDKNIFMETDKNWRD